MDPTTTPCEVCPFTGGAYKPTFRTGKWAHSLCCQWIPEIYVTAEPKKPQPYLSLLNLDKKRYKLKCALCHNTKGAAVQCSFGRCTTSVHPWCALKDPQGFTRRVVVNPEGETLWEIFCKTHASAVSEPLKPKPKAKMSVPIQIEEPSLAGSSYSSNSAKKDAKPAKERYSDIGSYFPSHHNFSSARNTLTMAHAKNFNASCLLALKDGPAAQSDGLSATEHAAAEDEDVEVEGSEDEFFSARGRQASGSKQSKQQHGEAGKHATSTGLPSRGEPAAPGGSNSGSSFPILSMLEWPGISEGEPMDLDHFWNVVSGHYPEDHPKEVN